MAKGFLKIYDSNEVTVAFGAASIDSVGGYGEDEFVRVESPEDFVMVKGTDGEVTRSKSNDQTATVTITLMQSSSANDLLASIRALDLAAGNGAGVGALLINDRQGRALFAASKAWIEQPPAAAFGKQAGAREWVLHCADMVRFDGGN